MGFFYMDIWYLVLIVPAMIFSLVVQIKMQSAFSRYKKVYAKSGLTGAQIAERVLADNGVHGVRIEPIQGELTDHYDPKTRVIRLSTSVYGCSSVAALGVAAHEAGHAVQHAQAYQPLLVRNRIVPVVNFSSGISWWVFILGLFMGLPTLAYVGVGLFAFATLFHLITLPVEVNASNRALHALHDCGALDDTEIRGTRKVLSAAAMTYVAALITSFASLLRMLLIVNDSRRRN